MEKGDEEWRKGTVLFFKVDGSDSNDTVTYSYDNIAKILSKNTMLNYLVV